MNDEENDLDLDAWEPQLPPPDFASRVLAEVRATPSVAPAAPAARTRRRWPAIVAGTGALAVAAAILLGVNAKPASGEAIAKDRIEVPIGKRALAVLEPGASVRWNGDDVEQAHGDVFYRVEPGAKFTVHTTAGDVEVKGTCFSVKVRESKDEDEETAMQKRDMKVAATSAVLSTLAFVAVYEGKVAVTHASERVELRAGEKAQTGERGVRRVDGDVEQAIAAASAEAESSDPQVRANQNLVRQVGEYRSRLEALAKQKSDLEDKLKRSEQTLSAQQDGSPAPARHAFDLTPDDWKDLAKDGTMKYQVPCMDSRGKGWTPSADKLNALGLTPQDGAPIAAAYARSNQRLGDVIMPLCAAAVGGDAVAKRIGADTCIHIVLDTEKERDPAAAVNAMKEVGEIRAGTRPMPGPNEKLNPVEQMFLATTGSSKALEDDLAQSFGPDEAHRLVYSDEMCMGRSVFSNSKKPQKL